MEPTQILLFVVITTLTIILTLIGVQLYFLLKDLRKSIKKVDILLTEGTQVTEKLPALLLGSLQFSLELNQVLAF